MILAIFPPWPYVRRIAFMSTSATQHHHVRKSPHRRPPVERALVKPWRWSVRAREPCPADLREFRGTTDMCGVRGMCAPTKRPKLDRSARTHYRGALLERWLAQF